MKKNMLLIVSALLLGGCIRGEGLHRAMPFIEPCPHYNRLQVATYYGTNAPVKKPYGTVAPYYNEGEVKQPFERIAFMSCEGQMSEEAAILKAMLYRGADMGADGILLNAGGIGQEEMGVIPIQGEGQSTSVHVTRESINVRWGWMSQVGGNTFVFRAQAIRFKKSN